MSPLSYCAVFMQGLAYSAITEEAIDAFLAEQGVPKIAIQKLPFDLKKRIYLGESQVEVGEPTYGVFTDDYRVEYTLENGRVVMDQQSRSQLRKLLNDEEAVANVLLSNEQAELGLAVGPAENIRSQDALGVREAEVHTYLEFNRDKVQSLKEMPEEAVVRTIKNWKSVLFCIHRTYTNTVSQKLLVYTWEWNYSPFNTLTDKAAMAWSGSFAAKPESFRWWYQGYDDMIVKDYLVFDFSGENYTDYEPNVGIGTDIDIKGQYHSLRISRHAGLLTVTLRKYTTDNSIESAVGRYYHKYFAISPSGSLSFSSSGRSASISISWDKAYDKAPDAGCDFRAITEE